MMIHLLAAAATLALASPASATQGFICSTTEGSEITLSIVVGTQGVAGANIRTKAQFASTNRPGASTLRVGQSWIDEQLIFLDLEDQRTGSRVARLKAKLMGQITGFPPGMVPPPPMLDGELEYGSQRYSVRCAQDQ